MSDETLLFLYEDGRHIPALPWDADGQPRSANGVNVFTAPEVATRMNISLRVVVMVHHAMWPPAEFAAAVAESDHADVRVAA